MDRMEAHDATNLVRTWASTGQLPDDDITRALQELERLVVQRTKAQWLIGRLAEAWPGLRDNVGALVELFD